MQRLLVALLAAVDAAIAAAVGLAALLAPITLLWTLAIGTTGDWGALWPTAGTLWQFGHGVPIDITLADTTLVAAGVPPEAAEFVLSVTPLAFLFFTLFFAARSGVRAARSGVWMLGVVAGTVGFAAIATIVALTSQLTAAATPLGLAIALPSSVYLVGVLSGAIWFAWREGDEGPIDRLHDLVDSLGDWSPVPGEAVRGAAAAIVTIVGAAALAVAVSILLRGGSVVALFQSARVDVLGATVLTLGALAYLPTMVVWAASWLAGAGFAVGAGTAVSPAGTQLGVVPGIPIFGLLPEVGSFWMLIVVLIPVGAGAFAGWLVRSRLVWEDTGHGVAPRATIAVGIAGLSAGAAALAAMFASGSIGPGRMAVAGPQPGMFALAVGVEVLIGAAIMLLAPRNRDELAEERMDRWVAESEEHDGDTTEQAASWPTAPPTTAESASAGAADPDQYDTVPLDDLAGFPDDTGDGDGSKRR